MPDLHLEGVHLNRSLWPEEAHRKMLQSPKQTTNELDSSVELKACVSERTPLAGDTEHDEAGDELTWADLVLDPSFP